MQYIFFTAIVILIILHNIFFCKNILRRIKFNIKKKDIIGGLHFPSGIHLNYLYLHPPFYPSLKGGKYFSSPFGRGLRRGLHLHFIA